MQQLLAQQRRDNIVAAVERWKGPRLLISLLVFPSIIYLFIRGLPCQSIVYVTMNFIRQTALLTLIFQGGKFTKNIYIRSNFTFYCSSSRLR